MTAGAPQPPSFAP
eukprot:s1236_g1.t1